MFLIDSTLAENIAFGIDKKDIDQEKLNQAIKLASLTELVEELEHGVETMVGERGSLISGGQRQRVGIARALYSGAEILFFDEATSALDSQTETEITEAINNLSKNDLTMFIIAHRITTLKYCNRIFKLDQGKLDSSIEYTELVEQELN